MPDERADAHHRAMHSGEAPFIRTHGRNWCCTACEALEPIPGVEPVATYQQRRNASYWAFVEQHQACKSRPDPERSYRTAGGTLVIDRRRNA